MNPTISRRTALKGLGTIVALPWLESLASAAPASQSLTANGAKRVAWLYVPNGAHMEDWTPKNTGKIDKLPDILAPLAEFQENFNVLSGLKLDKANANGDGPGDHARAMSAFLTGRQARKTHGADIRAGQSADQHVAGVIGDQTRFPSLELGIERGGQSGNCDSGYSCAYSSNMSWRSESTPNAKETDPKAVFDRLFGGNDPKDVSEARAKRELYNKSVLDYVMDDAKALTGQLGQGDRRKLDEYLSAVREVEQRIERTTKLNSERPPVAKPDLARPTGVPKEMKDHVRLMCDLMVLAFQADLTRTITLPLANDGSNRAYPTIGVPDGHHDCSHHGKNADKQAKIKKINTFHIEQLAYLLGKLKATKDVSGKNLLESTLMVYGSGIGDGDRHNHDDLPILLLGNGGGVEGGRHLKFNRDPLMNLYLTMFEKIGAPAKTFGDSTGVLKI